VGNRERAFQIFAVASLLEARGANPYRVRAYRRAALRLLRMREDATAFLDEQGELDLPGLGTRLRRKLGELVRSGHLSFHDELLAAEPKPIRTLMTVPGIGPKTADRLVGELKVRGLKSLARAARQGRLQRLRGIGPGREQAWGEAAELLLAPASAAVGLADVGPVVQAPAEAIQMSFLTDDGTSAALEATGPAAAVATAVDTAPAGPLPAGTVSDGRPSSDAQPGRAA
jgi:DNA polymerase (family 10)